MGSLGSQEARFPVKPELRYATWNLNEASATGQANARISTFCPCVTERHAGRISLYWKERILGGGYEVRRPNPTHRAKFLESLNDDLSV